MMAVKINVVTVLGMLISLVQMIHMDSIMDMLRKREDLSQFLLELQRDGLHQAYMNRQVTVLVPTNKAMQEYRGRRGEDLVLNHMINSIVIEDQLGDRLSSLVTGSPPIWVTKRSAWLYFNQARAVERNIQLQSDSGEQQKMFIIDSVLEPLLPISFKNASFTQDVTAGKLLERSTLYNLGEDGRARIFFHLAKINKRDRMFDVKGKHTFFFPVDSAFDVIAREFVDAKVVEAHIVPQILLLTTLIPTGEVSTVAWEQDGVKVNVSLQPSGAVGGSVMVRSNTIVGDRFHGSGMVVSRIVKGNIPVQNGIVHLIDKPLMVVARSLYDYVMEEGKDRNNRLYSFAQMIKDKGGTFGEALLESKDGTLLAPSNEAFRKVDRNKLDYILGHQNLRNEVFGLHFVRERLGSTDLRLRASGEQMYSVAASWATNRVWFNFEPNSATLTVEGRGTNATALEKDIGTYNGVIHVVDTFLGIPHLSIADKMRMDPLLSHSWSLSIATRLSNLFAETHPNKRFTFLVPTNNAWEKVKRDFSTVFLSLTDINNPEYPTNILKRHFIISDRDFTIEQLVERSLRSTKKTVKTEGGELRITSVGSNQFSAYDEWYVSWDENCKANFGQNCQAIKGKIVRPNIECTNGYIHIVDTVMLDGSPPWSVGGSPAGATWGSSLLVLLIVTHCVVNYAAAGL